MVAQGQVAILRTSVAVLWTAGCRMLMCGRPSKIIGGAPDSMEVRAARRAVVALVTRAGLESGRVMSFPTAHPGAPALSAVDLRALTGHTRPEDIEIRAHWTDRYDKLIFAGSSWGNDTSRSDSLPSFFVLRLT